MKKQRSAEGVIERLRRRITVAQIDALIPDKDSEFQVVADAIMAWYQLLFASGIFKSDTEQDGDTKVIEVLASSLVVLGTLVKTVYALGIRRGQRAAREG